MEFKIIGSDGKIKMTTECPNCMYDDNTLTNIFKNGYTFKLNDQDIGLDELIQLLKTINHRKEKKR